MQILRKHPILLLLIINIIVGVITFRSYGLSWDEPLFYDYANALRYAYTPTEWFSGNFDLQNAYGASGTDHANRGPAYILIARPFVAFVESLGVDNASAWHLINFLTFQLGVYLFYRFTVKWMSPIAAVAASAFFSWQPLLWGHAFINPKDIPFLVFFIGAMCFGFELVDDIVGNEKAKFSKILTAAFFLGIATSIRVLGPLSAVLTGLYALSQLNKIKPLTLIKYFAAYAVLTLLIAFIAWPYLWTNPLLKFVEVFGFMSDNPTQLTVLFMSQQYKADELPRRYLPTLLGYTLTEPVWILFIIGSMIGFWRADNKKRTTLILILLWFLIPAAYVILRKPPMYDGFRHFLFILPPVFIFAGFAFDKFFETIKNSGVKVFSLAAILAFGIIPSVQLHPYEYAYYNSFIGGTTGAFRHYETEYWLTCYREATLRLNEEAPAGTQLFVRREPYIAAYYASSNITIRDHRTEAKDIRSGDYILISTRSNEDTRILRDQPPLLKVSRNGATFCVVKKVP
ncbi:MAG: hypothetical protein IH588_02815 [Anaerolineales bacterium]|nr:hypothetical protein [Anaerolineales bacterium]